MKLLEIANRLLAGTKKLPTPNDTLKNVLVVSNTGLGDTLLSLPAIQTLRQSFPHLHISFMVDKRMYPLFKQIDYVDDFLLYESGVLSQISMAKELKKRKYDTIFLLHSNGPEDIFLSLMSGAGNILKMTHNQSHPYKELFLNPPVEREQHETLSRLDLVKYFSPEKITERISLPFQEIDSSSILPQEKCYPLIGFQVGAQDTYKMWPIEYFITLAERIFEAYPQSCIVLLGATSLEKELTQRFMQGVSSVQRVRNLCGATALDELPAVLNKLDLLVTNDTGTMHLAIALQVRTLSLFGPTNAALFGPNQDLHLHKVIQKDVQIRTGSKKKSQWEQGAMKAITVDEVFETLQTMVNVEPRSH